MYANHSPSAQGTHPHLSPHGGSTALRSLGGASLLGGAAVVFDRPAKPPSKRRHIVPVLAFICIFGGVLRNLWLNLPAGGAVVAGVLEVSLAVV